MRKLVGTLGLLMLAACGAGADTHGAAAVGLAHAMRKTRASLRILLAVFAVWLVTPAVAQAYDTDYGPLYLPGTATVRHSVPVYLYVPAGTTTMLGFPVEVAEQELKLALHQWLEESGARFVPFYAGRTTSDDYHGRVIVGVRTLNCLDSGEIACVDFDKEFSWGGPFLVDWRHVGAMVGLRPGGSADLPLFHTILFHELGHAWGLGDTYGHGWPEQTGGIMGGYENHNGCSKGSGALGVDDMLGMQEIYGERTFALYYRESIDAAVSWRDPDYADQSLSLSTVSLGGSGSRQSFIESFVTNHPDGVPLLVQTTTQASSNAYTETDLPDPPTARSPVSFAQKSETAWMVLYAAWATTSSCYRSLVYAITEDGGLTYTWGEIENGVWLDVPRYDILRTPFPHATAAYDVFSDRYVVAFLETARKDQLIPESGDGWVRLATVDARRNQAGFYPQRWMSSLPKKNTDGVFLQTKWRGWHGPAVACTAYDAQVPCLVAWLDEESPHGISWLRFATGVEGNEDFRDLSVRYSMFKTTHKTTIQSLSRPSLLAQTNRNFPFVLAVKQDGRGGQQLVSLTKAADESDWNTPALVATFRDSTQFFAPTLNEIQILSLPRSSRVTTERDTIRGARELHYRYGIGSL